MTLQWVATDLRTGAVLADLPTFEADYPLRRTIGAYDTGQGRLWLDGAPENWQRAILEGGAVLHCYDDEDPARAPQWSGWVVEQTRDTDADAVELALATGEAYLDRRYVGDVTYSGTAQNALVADLVTRYVAEGAKPGLPITVQQLAGANPARDRTYFDTDNAMVYTRLRQLAAVLGGPEWTVEWAWSADGLRILPALVVGARIGAATPAGLGPAASFEMPGCVVRAQQVRSFAAGRGANDVLAYSSGEGDATPRSQRWRAADDGRPLFEYRWQPSSSITNVATLDEYARQALAILAPGARALTLVADLGSAPRLGTVWRLGDDVGYRVGGYDQAAQDDLAVAVFPGGLSGVGRVIAYELGESTITPILAEAQVYSEDAV